MAGLPKSFAKMGFKKGWAAFKQSRKKKQAHKRIVREYKKVKAPKGIRILSPVPVKRKGSGMKIAKAKIQALRARASKAVSRARNSGTFKNHGEAIQAIGLGAIGAVASSYGIGMIPLPASLPKPGAIKSGLQAGAGVFLAMQKNKQLKYAGYGMAVLGVVGMVREILNIPTFAGEVDAGMFGELLQGDEAYMGQGDLAYMGQPMGEPLSGGFDPFN